MATYTQTGYFGHLAKNTQSKVHVVTNGKPDCGTRYTASVFQWCANGLNLGIVTCTKCRAKHR